MMFVSFSLLNTILLYLLSYPISLFVRFFCLFLSFFLSFKPSRFPYFLISCYDFPSLLSPPNCCIALVIYYSQHATQDVWSKMKIDDSVVFHYLYGYQTMRLASQEEIRSCQTSGKRSSQMES